MDYKIHGQVAVVTGGARGLGEAMCKALAKEGSRIVVWDLDGTAAQKVADSINGEGGEALAVVADVSKRASVERSVNRVLKEFGKIHVLVNNAGFSRDAPLMKMSDAQWRSVIDVCLTGTFLVSQAVAKGMVRRRYGRIINISSRAHLGEYMKANYSAAKAGVIGLTSAFGARIGSL